METSEINRGRELVVAIVTWNSAGDIAACLDSIPTEITTIVCDNGSSDDTRAIIESSYPEVRLLPNRENVGFAAACNLIARESESEYILFLNPDTVVSGGSLAMAVTEIARKPATGLLSVAVADESGSLNPICNRFPTAGFSLLDGFGLYRFIPPEKRANLMLGDFFDHRRSADVDWVYGAFMLVRRQALEEIGGVPEDYFLFAEDMDLAYQLARKGWKCHYFADVSVVHRGNRSAGQLPAEWRIRRTMMSKYLFCLKNFGQLRTRFIQSADLAGNLFETLSAMIRGHGREQRRVLADYRRIIVRSLVAGRRRLVSELHRRPSVS